MAYAKVCRYDARRKIWINTWTERPTTQSYAKRLNNRYIVLRKSGIPQNQITLAMLRGHRLVYDSRRSLEKQSRTVKNILTKVAPQATGTRIGKKKVFVSPHIEKRKGKYRYGGVVSKKKVKRTVSKIKINGYPVYLYRMTLERNRVYHLIHVEINEIVNNGAEVRAWRDRFIKKELYPLIDKLPWLVKKYPFYTKLWGHYGLVKIVHLGGQAMEDSDPATREKKWSGGTFIGESTDPSYIKKSTRNYFTKMARFLDTHKYVSTMISSVTFMPFGDTHRNPKLVSLGELNYGVWAWAYKNGNEKYTKEG